MLPRRTTCSLLLLLALAAAASSGPARAQEGGGGPQVKQLQSFNGPWRVHTGDLPLGASPNLDDSVWQQIDLSAVKGKNMTDAQGVAWFRALIPKQDLPTDAALLVAPLADGCQIFVNGAKVADCNQLPGQTVRSALPCWSPSASIMRRTYGLAPSGWQRAAFWLDLQRCWQITAPRGMLNAFTDICRRHCFAWANF